MLTGVITEQVVMFSWTQCTFCKRAKALLNDLGAKYTVVEMDTLPRGMALKAELGYVSASVPCVLFNQAARCCKYELSALPHIVSDE